MCAHGGNLIWENDMKAKSLLKPNSVFLNYAVVEKLSTHHEGTREVYSAVDIYGRDIVLVIYNAKSKRLAAMNDGENTQPDFIDEIGFYKSCKDLDSIPEYVDSGVHIQGRKRLCWLAMLWANGTTLDEELKKRKFFSKRDAIAISQSIAKALEAISCYTCGGGHYNVSTENVIVNYVNGKLSDVKLIGLSNIGTTYNGSAPIEESVLDKRFRAPETYRGQYSTRSDLYSLGMLLLTMIMGYPTADDEIITSSDYYKAIWSNFEGRRKSLPLTLILRKATDFSPDIRFVSVGKFMSFVQKGCKKEPKTKPEIETSTSIAPSTKRECVGGLDDVAGMAELKKLFRRDFISIVQNPMIAQAYAITPSNCMLLYGPHGCGKTFIASKAAQESGIKYKVVNPSELGSIYIHGAQQKIAELFEEAEQNAPMILIFDEFDALAPIRDSESNQNQASEVNELLTQLNNCASRGIYVLATTNRPTMLDPAIMRKGRIDRTIYVPLPDLAARKELFKLELSKRPITEDIEYEQLAAATENYTCSDIAYIVEESARLCFEETLTGELNAPLPLSMERIMAVIKSTNSSVSDEQRLEYLRIKDIMENKKTEERVKVGFAV